MTKKPQPLIGEMPCRCAYKWHLWHIWRPCKRRGWELFLGYCDRCAKAYPQDGGPL